MRLDALARRALFNTDIQSHQLQKFLFKKPDLTAELEEIEEIFSDISKGSLMSTIFTLSGKNIIEVKGKKISLIADKMTATTLKCDIVWKDIKLLKTFTSFDIQRDTGFDIKAIRGILRRMAMQGLITAAPAKSGTVKTFTLTSDAALRPISQKKKRAVLADKVFKALKTDEADFTLKTAKQLLATLDIDITQRYLATLIRQWEKDGSIEAVENIDRKYKTYRIISPKRPSVLSEKRRIL